MRVVLAESLALAALVVVPLAQVPLVAYLSRYVALDADADRPNPREGYVTYGTTGSRPDAASRDATSDSSSEGRTAAAPGAASAPGTDGRTCPNCRRRVPDAYDFCGECTTRLPARGGHR